MIETIEISKLEYYNLLVSEQKLYRLENGGVDNWEHYSDSIYGDDLNEQSWDDFEEETKRKVWPDGVR